jgi:hypothetical protein
VFIHFNRCTRGIDLGDAQELLLVINCYVNSMRCMQSLFIIWSPYILAAVWVQIKMKFQNGHFGVVLVELDHLFSMRQSVRKPPVPHDLTWVFSRLLAGFINANKNCVFILV